MMSSRPSQIASYTKLMYLVTFDNDYVIKSKYQLLYFWQRRNKEIQGENKEQKKTIQALNG